MQAGEENVLLPVFKFSAASFTTILICGIIKRLWGCTGFDREHAVGEAVRMRCVKWQN